MREIEQFFSLWATNLRVIKLTYNVAMYQSIFGGVE